MKSYGRNVQIAFRIETKPAVLTKQEINLHMLESHVRYNF